MNKRWTVGDLIDFDYLLEQDRKVKEEDVLKKRDRAIYLEKIQILLPQNVRERPFEEASKKLIIRFWFFFMEKSSSIFPGKLVNEGLSLLRVLFFMGGVLTGLAFCLSLFSYTGKLPLNISYFLGIILVPQILLMLFTMAALFLMMVNPAKGFRFGLYPVFGLLVEFFIKKLLRKTMDKLSGDKKGALFSALGIAGKSKKNYGMVFFWPMFILMQLFGVGFDLGVVASTLGRVAFSDIAFGWQSTLNLSYAFVFKAVSAIAFPWSWVFPSGVGFPSLEQIQGTRLILKDGIYNLATQDLVSWWPFLVLSVIFYALLPRFLLLVFGYIAQEKSLNNQHFDGWETGKLINRLVSPIVSTETFAPQEAREIPAMESSVKSLNIKENEEAGSYLALVNEDIFDLVKPDEFKQIVQQSLNCHIGKIMRTGIDSKFEIESIGNLSLEQKNPVSGIIFLQEAWLPPIREILGFIQKIRNGLRAMPLVVVLIGRPGQDTIFTGADPQDIKVWTMKINTLGDPLVHLETLVKK